MFSVGKRRFLKNFFKFLLFIYVIVSLGFIGYFVYTNFMVPKQEEVEDEPPKEEVEDLAEGKIYLNNTLVYELYDYLPRTSMMYNLSDNLYQDFDQNVLKARAFELVEKADSEENGQFILSETTLNAQINALYGDIKIQSGSFSYTVTKPLLDTSITGIKCTYNKNKYTCGKTKEIAVPADEMHYIDSATKDENGSIHIYERYFLFVKNGNNYDLYKDINKKEKITTITSKQRSTYTTGQYLEEYPSIPTYEHIFKRNGTHYYLYETKMKEA